MNQTLPVFVFYCYHDKSLEYSVGYQMDSLATNLIVVLARESERDLRECIINHDFCELEQF